ncbi:MAG: 30S ribosomal protein S27ae [Candidatus Diapherotrites archaeon]
MADKGGKAKGKKKKSDYYKISGEKAERKNKACPKCGAGVFLAAHKDRVACGKCGYTEWHQGAK